MIILKADELENFDNSKGTSVTIGKFDGVHKGHAMLIEETVRYARYSGLVSCVVTFNNTADIYESDDSRLLTTFEEKCILFEKMGVEVVVVLEFTEVLKNMTPRKFIDFFLAGMLNASSVTVGSDFRFGINRLGSVRMLAEAQMDYGFNLTVLEKETASGEEISSTRIRELVKSGELKQANSLLGYDYLIAGITEKGKKKGKEIGVPTINLYPPPEKLIPFMGVYASRAVFDGKEYLAVTNIGTCPTVNDNKKISIETHLINYSTDTDSYGKPFRVHLTDYIRNEIKFDSVDALYEQMQDDINTAEKLLAQ